MLHHLKIKEEFADAIVRGEKTFEIRINDRGFQKGDLIEFITVQEDLPFPDCHPIHNRTYEITYVMNGWGLKNGYVVFGIREEDTSIKCQFAEHDADGCLEDRAISLNAVRDMFQKLEYEHKECSADSEYMLALWDAANEIRLLPPVTPQPCEDAISRDAVIKLAYDMSEIDGEHFDDPCMVVDVEDIQKLPPVTPKTGHWIETGDVGYIEDTAIYEFQCSKCKSLAYFRKSFNEIVGGTFCPSCGADTRGDDNE